MTQDHSEFSAAISSVEEIIEDARQGRMYILVDHEDRENEGDICIPAENAQRMLSILWRPMGAA